MSLHALQTPGCSGLPEHRNDSRWLHRVRPPGHSRPNACRGRRPSSELQTNPCAGTPGCSCTSRRRFPAMRTAPHCRTCQRRGTIRTLSSCVRGWADRGTFPMRHSTGRRNRRSPAMISSVRIRQALPGPRVDDGQPHTLSAAALRGAGAGRVRRGKVGHAATAIAPRAAIAMVVARALGADGAADTQVSWHSSPGSHSLEKLHVWSIRRLGGRCRDSRRRRCCSWPSRSRPASRSRCRCCSSHWSPTVPSNRVAQAPLNAPVLQNSSAQIEQALREVAGVERRRGPARPPACARGARHRAGRSPGHRRARRTPGRPGTGSPRCSRPSRRTAACGSSPPSRRGSPVARRNPCNVGRRRVDGGDRSGGGVVGLGADLPRHSWPPPASPSPCCTFAAFPRDRLLRRRPADAEQASGVAALEHVCAESPGVCAVGVSRVPDTALAADVQFVQVYTVLALSEFGGQHRWSRSSRQRAARCSDPVRSFQLLATRMLSFSARITGAVLVGSPGRP